MAEPPGVQEAETPERGGSTLNNEPAASRPVFRGLLGFGDSLGFQVNYHVHLILIKEKSQQKCCRTPSGRLTAPSLPFQASQTPQELLPFHLRTFSSLPCSFAHSVLLRNLKGWDPFSNTFPSFFSLSQFSRLV